jgi:hypothetical protein
MYYCSWLPLTQPVKARSEPTYRWRLVNCIHAYRRPCNMHSKQPVKATRTHAQIYTRVSKFSMDFINKNFESKATIFAKKKSQRPHPEFV